RLPVMMCVAANTCPMPPRPMRCSTRKRPPMRSPARASCGRVSSSRTRDPVCQASVSRSRLTSRWARPIAVGLAPSSLLVVDRTAAADDPTERARTAFERGVALAQAEQWGEALAAFEEAAAARDHPRFEYDIGFCKRALGRYAAARLAFRRALRDP